MAVVAFLVLIFAVTGRSSATWCICKKGLSDSVLQKSLDYACGAGADCNPIHQNGVCYLPNTVQDHCSYAVNSYFQRKGQAQGSCDFAGTAIISTSDPSHSGCAYPSSASTAGTSTTPVTTTPSTTTPNSSSTTTSPYTATPSTGVLGGGIGTSPSGMNTDYSHGGRRLFDTSFFSSFMTLLFTGLMFWWG
ncbi:PLASMODESMATA CALLOSE-BINDING PROTEIN 3-like isoform X1 [Juglans microcarpa x Juglans regia]|uniref:PLASMODESMATA CALLOSE-BINDING PROTEIN 3-like isoform X1 n=1 Tax=Juglans microcarpa x Juglans regia TaxID=2249226 RepID=UPI001B7F1E25|nr:PLASMODESMATA CALLOSE-BINDING PROTEIN 3-like isoform X1 [Juglans microcarpa x Juglans regia]